MLLPAFTGSVMPFQSTLPVRGATSRIVSRIRVHASFQSTLPVRGATFPAHQVGRRSMISIHAPRAGSDTGVVSVGRLRGISIHAPRAGSDC